MRKLKLVGICGKAGAGKDTLAVELCKHHNLIAVSFAYKLKEICSWLFAAPIEMFNDRDLKNTTNAKFTLGGLLLANSSRAKFLNLSHEILEAVGVQHQQLQDSTMAEDLTWRLIDAIPEEYPLTPRQVMQVVSDVIKGIAGENCFLDSTLKIVKILNGRGQGVVITDVRYIREAEACCRAGALMLGITRTSCETHNHSSETEVDGALKHCEIVFENNGTIAEFLEHAMAYVEK